MLATTPSFADAIYVNELPYDHVPLNSNTWQEVDMSYWTTINGKPYLNTINLLRPKTYFAQYHMDQVGQKLTLTLPEIGLNNTIVTIIAIKPAPQFKRCHQTNCSQVIGLFKHYAINVKTYRFKDLTTGNISIIHATTNHPFYVKNKHQFLPISEVSGTDQLVSHSNHSIKLICTTNQLVHCGVSHINQKLLMVYNLEVYQQHDYAVGQSGILVHNAPCDAVKKEIAERLAPDDRWIHTSFLEHITKEMDDEEDIVYVNSEDKTLYDLDDRKVQFSIFKNSYNKKEWTLSENYRNEESSYFMSDVIYKQATIAFPDGIEQPEMIMQEQMVNPKTMEFLKDLSGELTPEQTKLFMTQTPNGKSTRRILDLFNWEVEKVKIRDGITDDEYGDDVYKYVKDALVYLKPSAQ